MATASTNMTSAEIVADLTTLQSRMQFNTSGVYINGAVAFLNTIVVPANVSQFTFNTLTSTLLVVTQNSTGIVWTIRGSGFNLSTNPFFTGTRTSETFQFPADHVTLTSTPHMETGNFTYTITDTDLIGASVRVAVNNFVATQSTLTDAGIVGVLQGAFAADGNGTSTAFSVTNGTKTLSISGFNVVNNTVGPVGIVGPLFVPAALAGNDTITTTSNVGIDLFGFASNDAMLGGAGNDTLFGGLGNDTLNGGAGSDSMEGGDGNDIYIVNAVSDIATETNADSLTGGIDEVRSSVTHTLGNNLENLTLTGALAINGTGNVLNNILTGNAVANTLTGLDGNDTLNGGASNDNMSGGDGNDIYIVDAALDITTETNANSVTGGIDEVRSGVTRTLGDNLESLTLIGIAAINGTGNTLNNTITGNSSANILIGLDGNDTLNGGAGADTLNGGIGDDELIGGDGNDTYIIDNNLEIIIETNTAVAGGIDTVLSSDDFDANSSANRIGLENITLTGATAILATGNALDNVITGNAIANNLIGNDGNDSLIGNAGDDSLDGGTGNDILAGGDGLDTLNGGIGNDSMNGGAGSDYYYVDSTLDVLTESFTNALGGIDTIESTVTRTLGANFDNLTLTGTDNINGIGNELANELTGNDGNNSLAGGLGIDTLNGGIGNDTLNGGAANDSMTGGDGNDIYFVNAALDITIETNANALIGGLDEVRSIVTRTLGDNFENLTLLTVSVDPLTLALNNINATGNALANIIIGNGGNNSLNGLDGNDTLYGGLGNDSLDGGAGADAMNGGAGNDIYVVDDASDTVTELLTLAQLGGIDLVKSSVSFSMTNPNIDNLTLIGLDNIGGTGNVLNNIIIGNAGANILAGSYGNDTLIGNAGDDGLYGDVGNDGLSGGAGVDTLNGGTGNDNMNGGLGNDTYIVDSTLDVLTESLTILQGGGIDTVETTVSRTLGANFDNLTLLTVSIDPLTLALNNINATGNALNNILIGNGGNNILTGGLGADTLSGGAGNDTLNGGAGVDSLTGGDGNDIYFVNAALDITTETNASSVTGGTDEVRSSVNRTLSDNIENLSLLTVSIDPLTLALNNINGTGNGLNNMLIGNGGNNLLTGLEGDDVLNGGAGNDTLNGGIGLDSLLGGAGNDIYVVDNAGDILIELLNAGIDTVQSSIEFSLLDTDGIGVNGGNVENLILTGLDSINGTGNALNNIIIGNAGNNILVGNGGIDTLAGNSGDDSLDGGAGNDALIGGLGADVLTGGLGLDRFDFNLIAESSSLTIDTIADFSHAQLDKIDLSTIDAKAATPLINDVFTFIGNNAFSKVAGQLMFDTATHSIYGDVNGDSVADFQIILTGVTSLVAADFIL